MLDQNIIYDNSLRDFIWFASFLVTGILIKLIFSRILSNLIFRIFSRNGSSEYSQKFYDLLKRPLGVLIIVGFFYLAQKHLDFPTTWVKLIPVLTKIYATITIAIISWTFLRSIDFLGFTLLKKAELTESEADDQLVQFFTEAAKVILIVLSILFTLASVYDFNINSIIAGLGIGGLAFALAAKESLENLLGSFTIFLDKPFVKGDLVTVEDITGHVENVGFRSTRIRTIEKTFVTVPNKKMIDAKLDNLTLRTLRRVDFNIGLTYDTSIEQIKAICSEIKEILNSIKDIEENPIAAFHEFGDSSLNIRVLFFINIVEYNIFIEAKQKINYSIMEVVKKHKSEFAFPSRTVYLQQNNLTKN